MCKLVIATLSLQGVHDMARRPHACTQDWNANNGYHDKTVKRDDARHSITLCLSRCMFIKERGERSFENSPLKPSERQRIQFLSHTYIRFVNKTDPRRRVHRRHYAKVYKKRKAKTVPGSKLRVIGMVAKDKDWTEKEAVYTLRHSRIRKPVPRGGNGTGTTGTWPTGQEKDKGSSFLDLQRRKRQIETEIKKENFF